MHHGLKEAALLPVHFYRFFISPHLPPSCIYDPSCSSYMVNAVRNHGILKGFTLGTLRILRCHHTLFYGGHDPVPEQWSKDTLFTPYRIFFKHGRKKTK
ncbi:MAG: membrane protein insertion efficiency factor YidD [Sphaerochaetaceae bacterium]|nr:membrane protein insertion efficiency factor YidD [Sphaerochaetaceae bacterium]